jgi:hypothetical protein
MRSMMIPDAGCLVPSWYARCVIFGKERSGETADKDGHVRWRIAELEPTQLNRPTPWKWKASSGEVMSG